jgi:hypothetical protein
LGYRPYPVDLTDFNTPATQEYPVVNPKRSSNYYSENPVVKNSLNPIFSGNLYTAKTASTLKTPILALSNLLIERAFQHFQAENQPLEVKLWAGAS